MKHDQQRQLTTQVDLYRVGHRRLWSARPAMNECCRMLFGAQTLSVSLVSKHMTRMASKVLVCECVSSAGRSSQVSSARLLNPPGREGPGGFLRSAAGARRQRVIADR